MSSDVNPVLSKRRLALIAVAIFAAAFLLRLVGIGWGLPNALHNWSYHPDEPIVWLYAQQIEPTKLDFTPGFYNYGTLYLTTLRIATDVVAGYSSDLSPQDPSYLPNLMRRSHLAGRVINSLAGAGTAVIVFLILRSRASLLGAVAGAVLMGIAPGFLVHSRFQTVDVFATFLLGLSLFFSLKLFQEENLHQTRDAVLAGVFAGLSAGTKYTGIFVLLALYAAVFLPKRDWKLAVWGTVAAALSFVVVTPGALLETSKFVEHFVYEMRHTASGHGLVFVGTSTGYVYHLVSLFLGIGALAVLLGAAGLGGAAYRKHRWAWAVLAFAVPYYLLIGGAEVKFLRYTFPLYLPLALGFGWLVSVAHARGGGWRAVVVLAILALGGETAQTGLRGASAMTAWMSGEDPRDDAGRFLKQVSGPETTLGVVKEPWFYTPPVYPDTAAPRSVPAQTRTDWMAAALSPSVVLFTPGVSPDYVAVSSFEVADALRLKGREGLAGPVTAEVRQLNEVMDRLTAEYRLERMFGYGGPQVHDLEYIRPWVQIWKRKDLP